VTAIHQPLKDARSLIPQGGTAQIPHSHHEADDLLRRKCEIAARVKLIDARMEDAIRRATEIAVAAGAEMKLEDAKIDRLLKQYFATLTPEQLGDRKSVKLNFGVFGKRGGREKVSLVRGWTEALAIAALKAKGWASFVKTVETISKSSILAANAENRALIEERCGLRVEPGETFYVEPDSKALEGYGSEPGA